MASSHSRYNDIGRQFICFDCKPIQPNISAVLLGGSSIYSSNSGRDDHQDSDWDGAIVVPTKLAILRLVNEQLSSLMSMLGIVREECSSIRVPEQSSPYWNLFDAVRIAGFDRLDRKRSVKILSLDYFSTPKSSLRILSFKDRRIFEAFRPPATRYYRLHQAMRLNDGLFILHDPWIHVSPASVCIHGQSAPFAALGVTGDLLVSGFWLHGCEPHGRSIQKYILERYSTLCGSRVNAQSFAKHPLFSSEYRSWLTEELSELYLESEPPSGQPRRCCSSLERNFLCGEAIPALDISYARPLAQTTSLSSQSVKLYKQTETAASCQLLSSAFSSNSTASVITLPTTTGHEEVTKIFCKRSQYLQQEIQGAISAAGFGLRVQLPHATSSGELFYPFFEGQTQSELRLSLHHNGRRTWHDTEILLYAELVKAEDMLRLYGRCFTDRNMPAPEMRTQPIHRFFYSRLTDGVRFSEFYKDSLPIGGENLSMADFLKAAWKVNGVVYPSLGTLFAIAKDVLHPTSPHMTSCPIVFGLGDAHGANVMISNDVSRNSSRQILYVDYEVAGFHPIMLDIAKAFYNDVFFDTLYMDSLPEVPETMFTLDNHLITVDFPRCVDDITPAIFDVKWRYLLQPLFELARNQGRDLEKDIPLLSSALLVCATLTRNFSGHPDAFIRNMAAGVVLAQAVDLESFRLGLQSLGVGI
ncbi:MAG: hypothetical protein Q9216_003998 [Gyalolechia sp. 2 TL-2023]